MIDEWSITYENAYTEISPPQITLIDFITHFEQYHRALNPMNTSRGPNQTYSIVWTIICFLFDIYITLVICYIEGLHLTHESNDSDRCICII